MSKKIRILVFCGAGMATSSLVAQEIEEIMDDEKVRGTIQKCGAIDAAEAMTNVDLVFTTTLYDMPEGIKWLNVSPLISGIGEDECRDRIAKLLHEAANA